MTGPFDRIVSLQRTPQSTCHDSDDRIKPSIEAFIAPQRVQGNCPLFDTVRPPLKSLFDDISQEIRHPFRRDEVSRRKYAPQFSADFIGGRH
jgi:hypothetical protein